MGVVKVVVKVRDPLLPAGKVEDLHVRVGKQQLADPRARAELLLREAAAGHQIPIGDGIRRHVDDKLRLRMRGDAGLQVTRDILRRALQPGVGGRHLVVRDGIGQRVVDALRAEGHVRPLVHVVALCVKRLAQVFKHLRDAHQQHVEAEQIVHVVGQAVVPQIGIDLLHVLRRAHEAVRVHGENRELQLMRLKHMRKLPAHLRRMRAAHGQLDARDAEGLVDHRGMAHLDHRRAKDHGVVVVVFRDAGVVVALLVVQRQDGGFAVMLKGIDEIDRQRAERQQRKEKGEDGNRPAFGF